MQNLNRTLIYSLVIGGFFLSIICVFILIALRPDASASLIQFIGTLPALAGSVIAIVYTQIRSGQKLETIKQQTNGTLTKLVNHVTGEVPMTTSEIAQVAQTIKQQGSTIEGKQ